MQLLPRITADKESVALITILRTLTIIAILMPFTIPEWFEMQNRIYTLKNKGEVHNEQKIYYYGPLPSPTEEVYRVVE